MNLLYRITHLNLIGKYQRWRYNKYVLGGDKQRIEAFENGIYNKLLEKEKEYYSKADMNKTINLKPGNTYTINIPSDRSIRYEYDYSGLVNKIVIEPGGQLSKDNFFLWLNNIFSGSKSKGARLVHMNGMWAIVGEYEELTKLIEKP